MTFVQDGLPGPPVASAAEANGAVVVMAPIAADPLLAGAVDEAIAGEFDVHPDLQPERLLGRSPQDFASLYIRHRTAFAMHARRFLRDPRDVDEVMQETFLRLFLAMPEIESEPNALRFSRRVMTNLCIDRYRAEVRRPHLVDLSEGCIDIVDASATDEPVLAAADAAVVREALALLSPLHRAALIKREIEEKPLPAIAAELSIPLESTKHVLHRARRALRRLLVGTSADPDAARRGAVAPSVRPTTWCVPQQYPPPGESPSPSPGRQQS